MRSYDKVRVMQNYSTSPFFFKYILYDAVFYADYEYDIGLAF
jgi:hypothetical protein